MYIITSGSTASASELLMNALSAYIDVNIVGTTTVGKQVGSITLYDSDNLRKTGANFNTDHNYALQPLVLEITNKNNVNFPNGITPGTDLPGIILAEDFDNLGILGDVNEPLLSRTIQYIITGSKTNSKQQKAANFDEIYDSKMATPAGNNMLSEGRNIEL